MRMRILTAATLFASILAGCASPGVKVDPASLQQFQKGKTTLPEVVTALGQPTSVVTKDDGTEIATYSFAQVQTRPETFIPYIGPLVGGADTHATAVVFNFDSEGILQGYSTVTSNVGTGMGFGSSAAR